MSRKAKIAAELNSEQIHELFSRLAQLKNPTLENIISVAEEFGVSLSLTSATTTRELFEAHLARIERAKEVSTLIQQAMSGEHSPLQGAAALAQTELFDELAKPDSERDMLAVAKAVSQLTNAHAKTELLHIAQQKAAREQQDWEHRQAKIRAALEGGSKRGGISEDTRKAIEEAAGLL